MNGTVVVYFFTWTEIRIFSLLLTSQIFLAETSKQIVLKQMLYHGKLQVEPLQCDSFKSDGKAFLQEKIVKCYLHCLHLKHMSL